MFYCRFYQYIVLNQNHFYQYNKYTCVCYTGLKDKVNKFTHKNVKKIKHYITYDLFKFIVFVGVLQN